MPTRTPKMSESSLLTELFAKVGKLEDTAKRQVLPPGFQFNVDATTGELSITRLSDGATQVIAF